MDKAEHAALLRQAIDASTISRTDIATAVDRGYRTVGNWTSTKNPTMPTAAERAILRRLLGPYDQPGDEVERAVFRSELTEDRAHDVVGYYKKRLREQREERAG